MSKHENNIYYFPQSSSQPEVIRETAKAIKDQNRVDTHVSGLVTTNAIDISGSGRMRSVAEEKAELDLKNYKLDVELKMKEKAMIINKPAIIQGKIQILTNRIQQLSNELRQVDERIQQSCSCFVAKSDLTRQNDLRSMINLENNNMVQLQNELIMVQASMYQHELNFDGQTTILNHNLMSQPPGYPTKFV
jgi:hypothetical protein